jgi:hypothetical protein
LDELAESKLRPAKDGTAFETLVYSDLVDPLLPLMVNGLITIKQAW